MTPTKFPVGCRVRIFGHKANDWAVKDGEVVEARDTRHPGNGMDLAVRVNGITIFCHPRQVRRLVKRERRRVWLHVNATNKDRVTSDGWHVGLEYPIDQGAGPWIEFIEVRRKPKDFSNKE